MEFRILGPLEVVDGERALALGGVKQRSLLAVLLQHANEIVSADVLVEELWGDARPRTAAKSIQVYVSRLRKELGPERLLTRGPGYVLRVEQLDLWTFERLRAEGRPQEALKLWQGPPFADLAYEPCVQAERARLEELRLAALEERIEAELTAGRQVDVIGELETLIAREPLRERFRAQLMLALYRSARQAEALETYDAARRELSDRRGLEPGGELQRLQHAILHQDPKLDLPDVPPTGAVLVAPSSPARLDGPLALAQPLCAPLILACVVEPEDIGAVTGNLAALKVGRVAAFSSPSPGADLARLAMREACQLIVVDELDRVLLETASCDVALITSAPRDGPVLVPFGAGRHDWAALELGARVAGATGAPLRLIGALSSGRSRDASRLLADASLIVQRRSGVVAEPLLARPGRGGVTAHARDAGLLVVGFPDRWREDGLGRLRRALVADPPAPTVLVRRGAAAEAPELTHFPWSLTA